MTQNAEIILEGAYQYFEKDVNFCHESFKLAQFTETKTYCFFAEVLSRLETGEFLKILIRYEMSQNFFPVAVRIEKSMGARYALETYKIDVPNLELLYTFQNSSGAQEFRRAVSAKHYLTAPALCTAGIFTLSKKFDASGRTPVTLIGAENEWSYAGPPADKIVYAELRRDPEDFTLNGAPLAATHLALFESYAAHGPEDVVDLFLSKHFAVPYQLRHGTQKVVVKQLKRNTI
jgi:hypothetical protein